MSDLPRDIRRKLAKLEALESGGVDNWDGFDFAIEEFRKENEKEEKAEQFVDELFDLICTENMIEQPAGVGCGYGIMDNNEQVLNLVLQRVKEFQNDPER